MNRKVNKIVLLVASIVAFIAILVLLTLAEPEEEPSDYRGQVSSSSSLDNELKFEPEKLKYEFAEYEKYSSDDSSGGLKGNRICIHGEILTICDDANKSLVHVSAAKTNNGDWIIELPKLKNSAKLTNYIRDKSVICYGVYTGIESDFNLPTFSLDKLLFDEKIFDYKSYDYNEFLELDEFLSNT
ncbi:MAG: hypothetical protein UD936_07995, partial [Acutalibacteraceae bacterium]|nr:hypothetical protein [Acutalibacteraceae bacterium]